MVKSIALCCRPSTGSMFQLEIPQNIIDKAIDIIDISEHDDGEVLEALYNNDFKECDSEHGNYEKEEQSVLYLLSYIVKNSPNAGEWAIRAEPLISMVDDDFETDYNRDINLDLPPKPPI